MEELTNEETGAQGKGSKTLMLGCGNSALGEAVSPARKSSTANNKMYDDGWQDIVNIDVSHLFA